MRPSDAAPVRTLKSTYMYAPQWRCARANTQVYLYVCAPVVLRPCEHSSLPICMRPSGVAPVRTLKSTYMYAPQLRCARANTQVYLYVCAPVVLRPCEHSRLPICMRPSGAAYAMITYIAQVSPL